MSIRRILLAALALALLHSSPAGALDFVSIGTGGVTGVYYPVGKAIAGLINENRDKYSIKATVESTGGSIFNVNAILAGDLDFGVAQSDIQYYAIKGIDEYAGRGPQKDLRAVFGLHTETFILCAAVESGIESYPDLKGKAVGVGNPGSGQRKNLQDILAAYGMSFDDLARAEGLKAPESAKMLQDGRIDAFVYTVGNPNGLVKEATAGHRKVRFIPADPKVMGPLIQSLPFYVMSSIPIGYYPDAENKTDVPTLAMKATLVTRAQVPGEVVYALVKVVFENLDKLKKLHPALSRLDPHEMLQGMSAPFHPGAEKYYREAGLIK